MIHTATLSHETGDKFEVDTVHLGCMPHMKRQGWKLESTDYTPDYELWYSDCVACGQSFTGVRRKEDRPSPRD